MSIVFEVEHLTTYRYSQPVGFGIHRAMFLPSGSYAGRILGYSAETNVPSKIRWISDTLSNNVAVFEIAEQARELSFTFRFRTVSFGHKSVEAFALEKRAEIVPVQYTPDEWIDLAPYLRPHTADPDGSVAAWAKSFILGAADHTDGVAKGMLDAIRDTFTYLARDTEGTQSPGETLAKRSGTCRDYAWLMMEALRRLGFACRFVTGYLYDSSLDGGEAGMVGSGATHAWLQVYLPGAGWLDYDPTNRIVEGFDLIRVGVARQPEQAVPLAGSWFGKSEDFLGLDVSVQVRKLGILPDFEQPPAKVFSPEAQQPIP